MKRIILLAGLLAAGCGGETSFTEIASKGPGKAGGADKNESTATTGVGGSTAVDGAGAGGSDAGGGADGGPGNGQDTAQGDPSGLPPGSQPDTLSGGPGTGIDTGTGDPLVVGSESGALTPLVTPGGAPGGIQGGHFDLDTSSAVYAFNAGKTDGHVHEYSDKHDVNGADFFKLLDKELTSIQNRITDFTRPFVLVVANAQLSTGAVVDINGVRSKALALQQQSSAAIAGSAPWTVYTLAPPSDPRFKQLGKLQVSFPLDVIAQGGLVPTVTSCVQKNKPGAKGEYRNGALVLQAVDASKTNDIDPATGTVKVGSTALLWEATLFWHWDGKCYGE